MLGIHKSAWLLGVLSAGLQIVIFPLPDLYFLCWFAVAPLLLALLHARAPETLTYQADGILYGRRQPGRVKPGNCCLVVAARPLGLRHRRAVADQALAGGARDDRRRVRARQRVRLERDSPSVR